MEIDIKDEAFNKMIQNAAQAYPQKAYGFLYGHEHGNRYITEVKPIVRPDISGLHGEINTSKDASYHDILPEDYLEAERYALAQELRLLGMYLTHPDHTAQPSSSDLKQAMPYFSYIVLAVEHGKVTDMSAWQLAEDGAFEEETISNHVKQ